MKRVTVLHTIESAGPGGAETVVLDLASRLDPGRFRSVALLPNERWLGAKLRDAAVPVTFADGSWYNVSVPRAIARLIRREGVDLVHSHLPDQNFYSCIAGRLTGCKTIVSYHGPVELSEAAVWKERVKLWVVRNSATRVVVVCDFVGKMLNEIHFPPEKIIRIHNGVHLERFGSVGSGSLRKELGLTNGTRLVGMVANIRRTKGHEFFIRAARRVLETVSDVRFVAVGDIDHQLAGPLWKLLGDLNVSDRVHFLGFREDIPQVLADLDVVVLSSTSEGFPLAALEAMAARKPLVTTRCGGPEEIVEDQETGYLVPPADPEALAGRVVDILKNPALASRLASSARRKVESEFSVSKMVADYERLYEQVLVA